MSASWYQQSSPCLCLRDDEQHPYLHPADNFYESSCTNNNSNAMSHNINSDFSWIRDNFTTFEDFSHFYDNHQAVPYVLTAVSGNNKNSVHFQETSQDKKISRQRNRRNDMKEDNVCRTRSSGKKGKERTNYDEQDATVNEDGFVYVRARRGEAVDSHSLAERVRRQKISSKMKLLQSLVPGCDKTTGKVPILDTIINYIHSLQDQVKSLMEELALVDPTFDVNYLALESSMMQTQESYATTAGSECTRRTSPYRSIPLHESSALPSPWLALLEEREYTI
ncbi:transcription factor BEE 2 [Beta vulgaris subsp. vulgaris]|uniref:transcription factor BEE 2 n=1 Tax=Beta vulgaris subsp. vulgaris TaxID=3555 RepID=UPI002037127E|nr:transcription factor BEE 2 [Beta vulgaris subsp. vulgaris]